MRLKYKKWTKPWLRVRFKKIALRLSMVAGVFGAGFAFSAHSECFIDGNYEIRCSKRLNGASGGPGPDGYIGVSWPVFTASTPAEVLDESARRARLFGNTIAPWVDQTSEPLIQHVRIDTPEKYPDVICLDFYHSNKKHSQTCFDTMEVTER